MEHSRLLLSSAKPPETVPAEYIDMPAAGGLLEYLSILYRSKLLLTVAALGGLLAAVLITVRQTPVFRARTSLEVQDLNENFLNIKQVLPVSDGKGFTDATDIGTQIKILRSESLIRRVIDKVQHDRPPVQEAAWVAWLRDVLKMPKPGPAGLDVAAADSHLTVRADGQTRIIEAFYDSTDPRFAADFVNTLAQEFIQSNIESRWQMSQNTGEWLSRQLQQIRVKLETSEDNLQSYARRTELIFTSEKSNIHEDKLRQLQEELSKAQSERISKQSEWEIAKSSSVDALPETLVGTSLRTLREKVTELRRERARLITTFTEKHSTVRQTEAQIALLEAAVERERALLKDRLQHEYESALRREKLLGSDYEKQLRLVTEQSEKAIQYNILKREVDSNRQLYDSMLQRVKEGNIASAMRSSNIRVVDAAYPPERPYSPRLPLNAAIGLFCGTFLGATWLIVRDGRDRTIRNPEDATLYLGISQLGVIPSASLGARRGLYGRKPAEIATGISAGTVGLRTRARTVPLVAESFRATLASILFASRNGGRPRVIVITSANPGEGKSTVASNLAVALAEAGHKTLLIDGDMRRPHLHTFFHLPNTDGLSDLLRDATVPAGEAFAAAVRGCGIPGLSVLSSGTPTDAAINFLYSPRSCELIRAVRELYDTVIIDTAPALVLADARVLGRISDAVVMVARSRKTSRDLLKDACDQFHRDGTNILGVVLNDWEPAGRTFAYGHSRYAAEMAQ
jgi:capsular exopolysaccharide synthesis family protein